MSTTANNPEYGFENVYFVIKQHNLSSFEPCSSVARNYHTYYAPWIIVVLQARFLNLKKIEWMDIREELPCPLTFFIRLS